MPSTLVALVYGLISGLVGGVVMGILLTMMESKLKASPPAILAEKFLGDANKKPLIMMPVMAMWGLVFAAVVSAGILTATYVNGLIFAIAPWLVLNVVMLPMAGAGLFGMSRWNMIPVTSAMMHAIWGLVTVGVYGLLISLLG